MATLNSAIIRHARRQAYRCGQQIAHTQDQDNVIALSTAFGVFLQQFGHDDLVVQHLVDAYQRGASSTDPID